MYLYDDIPEYLFKILILNLGTKSEAINYWQSWLGLSFATNLNITCFLVCFK